MWVLPFSLKEESLCKLDCGTAWSTCKMGIGQRSFDKIKINSDMLDSVPAHIRMTPLHCSPNIGETRSKGQNLVNSKILDT